MGIYETCTGCKMLAARPEADGSITEICLHGAFGSKRRTIENHPAILQHPSVHRPAWCRKKVKSPADGEASTGARD